MPFTHHNDPFPRAVDPGLARDSAVDLPVAMLMDLDDTIVSYSTYAGPCWKRVCYNVADRIEGVGGEELYRTLAEARTWFWADPIGIGRTARTCRSRFSASSTMAFAVLALKTGNWLERSQNRTNVNAERR